MGEQGRCRNDGYRRSTIEQLAALNESMRLSLCASEGPGECCDYHRGFWDGLQAHNVEVGP